MRIAGEARGRSRATVSGGFVFAVATDPTAAETIEEQTRNALALLDETLAEAGSAKSGLLQATVYLSDMAMKPRMDRVWCDWIGPEENWPQRACVGVALAGHDQIEIVVTAKVLTAHPDHS